ncbi:uncharacterized protein LOC135093968 [Scylla paramamosain]|uniref:uncharacterized protein LOC135093968 n=1 Tax=Scylla paramamosain TaxID=85552 RepID=UPI0030836232
MAAASLTGSLHFLSRSSDLLPKHTLTNTVMAKVLPPPPLLLLLLSLSPGTAPSHTLALDCSSADAIVKEKERKVIVKVPFDEVIYNIILFVKPESDFEGVRLDVQERDGTNHTAWLPAVCVPRDGTWREFLVWAGLTKTKVALRFRTGKCRKWCETKTPKHFPISVTVVAYGSSRWIKRYMTSNCNVTKASKPDPELLPRCQKPPSTKTITTTTPATLKLTQYKITITAASAAIVVVVLVVVVVVCWRRNSVTLPNEVTFRSQPAVPNHHLQFTTGQGQSLEQDDECFYYEIMPDLTARRVMVSRPAQFQPTVPNHRYMQFITGQGHTPDQDNECIYYEILPDLTSHRVMVSRPAQDLEEPICKSEHDVQLRSPVYGNVLPRGSIASLHWHLEDEGVSRSNISTVP